MGTKGSGEEELGGEEGGELWPGCKINKQQINNSKKDQCILAARTARCLEGQFILSVTFLTGY